MPERDDEEFWEVREDWSRRKHLITNYYIEPAIAKLGSASPDKRVIVVDGFAGRGTYEGGEPGSPVLLGQLADAAKGRKSPVDLRIYNTEPTDCFTSLAVATAQWTLSGVVTNLRGTFQEHRAKILAAAGDSPMVAFLDPFRPSHLLFEDLTPLLRRPRTDLLIVFHTPAIARIIRAAAPDAATPQDVKEKHYHLLDAVFGNDRWRDLLPHHPLDPDLVVSRFLDALLARGGAVRAFACAHGIEARYRVGLKYHMVLYTRHPEGVRLINDAFCKEQRDVYEQHLGGQLDLGLDEEVEFSSGARAIELPAPARQSEIQEALCAIGQEKAGKRWKREDLIFESILRLFGRFPETEHRRAVDALVQRNQPPRLVAPSAKRFSNGRIQTNPHTEMWFLF